MENTEEFLLDQNHQTDNFKELKKSQNPQKIEPVQQVQVEKGKKVSGGSFGSYNLIPEIVKAIRVKGYNLPTPIQRRAIPPILQGFNVIAMARTGSGKTGAFIIPIVQKLKCHSKVVGARCVILSPTREIAVQTAKYFKAIAKFTDLTFVLITGGNDMENQFERLLLNPDVIIATPGRLMHCIQEASLQLSQVQMVVYDEADRIFELGFAEQINTITQKMPKARQSLLFSATISSNVKDFTLSGIKDYKMVQVDKENKLSDDLKCHFFIVKTGEKLGMLLYIMQDLILKRRSQDQSIIFAATRHHVEWLHEICQYAGLKTTCIFGAMDQQAREERLASFRHKKVNFLIVTDLAARGIDIPLLQNVINYDFPPSQKLFIHRSGRTARAGQLGTSFTLLTNDEVAYMTDLSVYCGRKLHLENTPQNCNPSLNPQLFSFGTVPQKVIDEYQEYVGKLKQKNPSVINQMFSSVKNSLLRYNKTREPASQNGMVMAKQIEINVHPMLADEHIDEKDRALNEFKVQVSNYKPKASVLEIGILKTKDEEYITMFKNALLQQQQSQLLKRERIKMQEQYTEEIQFQRSILERNQIEMQKKELILQRKLQGLNNDEEDLYNKLEISRLSKARKIKLDKIKNNPDLDEGTKEQMMNLILQDNGNKGIKRSKIDDFKDKQNFIEGEKQQSMDLKVNSSNLWGQEEKQFLEDVTLNMIPDDDTMKNLKGKTAMRWDDKKKRYMLKKVDREGRVIHEKKNESGAKITSKMKENQKDSDSIFKKWQKRTHLSLQKAGEMEDQKTMDNAKRANEARKTMKDFKNRHGEQLSKGDDPRSNDAIIKSKKAKMLKKLKETKKPKGGRQYSEKALNKIKYAQKPSRSKMIVKKK